MIEHTDAESLLPGEVLRTAVRSGNELGWRADALPVALAAARARSLAVLGGHVQFVLPGGTCEMYWHNYDASPRRVGEPWVTYVARSHAEVTATLTALPAPEDLVREGVDRVLFLRERAAGGADLRDYLCYICYFDAEGTP